MANTNTSDEPVYDPAVHDDQPDLWVRVDLWCACGSVWRQRDPVALLAPQVRDWIGRHTGDGHGEASIADCIQEREARREAAYRVAGRQGEYQPREHPSLDTTCTRERPWPQIPSTEEGLA